jgi:hypothetical protein
MVACLGPAGLSAQESDRPKLFLTCPQECFDVYLRQELSYFNFVRDPRQADLNLVIVRQGAGGGGERFSLTVVRRDAAPVAAGRSSADSSFVAAPGAPTDVARRQLLQLVLRALQSELAGTSHAEALQLSLPPRSGDDLSRLGDPWDYWVIAPELRGDSGGVKLIHFGGLTAAITVRRITEPSKLRLRGSYTRWLSGYVLEDGSRVSGDVYGWEGKALYAHSLGSQWALGITATARGNDFENLLGHVRGGPIVEFNVFPYAENASQQLRAAYQVGAWANWYLERNVGGRTGEVRPYHALSLIADFNQAWGSIQWVGQANSFLDQPELFRLSTGLTLTLRLFEGLAISVEGMAAFVRDLINLRGRPVTDRELLLGTAQQPTDYTFEVEFALTYTFGSVHNTIVNPRFGRVDLEED